MESKKNKVLGKTAQSSKKCFMNCVDYLYYTKSYIVDA